MARTKSSTPVLDTKVYAILKTFDKYEHNRLRKYLLSPYFNANMAVVELYEYLRKYIFPQNGNTSPPTHEGLWKKIYKNKPYNALRFRKLISELLKLTEGFLAQQVYERDPIRPATDLMTAATERKLEKIYSGTLRQARFFSEQSPYRPATYYLQQYQIENSLYTMNEADTKRGEKSNIELIGKNLDYFYLAEKLRFACTMLSGQKTTTLHQYDVKMMEEITNHINVCGYDNIPAVVIHYQIYLTYIDRENTAHYFKLKMLLEKYGHKFSPDEANTIYRAALNYCTTWVNKGSQTFVREYFDLNLVMLEKELIYINGELPPWVFKNIVTSALRLGEFDWTEDFIHTYKDKLPISYRDNAVTFNLAQLYFFQKEYEKLIEQLRYVEYEDFAYNLNSKIFLIIAYFELDEIDPLYSLFDSFRVYLNRHKEIPTDKRTRHKNYISFTKRLVNIAPGDKKALEKLKTDINNSKTMGLKWLLEKVEELH